eukprot:GHVN01071959.1.p1 GENE.GHVN01071959.1~~GHVN01071959.1.p1  ORF type:complete len:109 (+),score=6.95 GHVN01071959.1:729-1055(+)
MRPSDNRRQCKLLPTMMTNPRRSGRLVPHDTEPKAMQITANDDDKSTSERTLGATRHRVTQWLAPTWLSHPPVTICFTDMLCCCKVGPLDRLEQRDAGAQLTEVTPLA